MLTIITPCSRPEHLPQLLKSIQFDKIKQWIIVYDTSKNRKYDKQYQSHAQIVEVECDNGISGNPQRNYGMSLVDDGYIYFLDDDNIIHPKFWSIIDSLDGNKYYTFNQIRNQYGAILRGNNLKVGYIDTAMFIVHKRHIGDIQWINDRYDADGYFITAIYNNHKDSHQYINDVACYYNFLRP